MLAEFVAIVRLRIEFFIFSHSLETKKEEWRKKQNRILRIQTHEFIIFFICASTWRVTMSWLIAISVLFIRNFVLHLGYTHSMVWFFFSHLTEYLYAPMCAFFLCFCSFCFKFYILLHLNRIELKLI